MIPINNKNLKELTEVHYKAIRTHFTVKKGGYTYKALDNWFKSNGLQITFEEVIKAKPNKLSSIINSYKSIPRTKEIEYINTGLFKRYFSNSSEYLKGGRYNAAELVKNLKLTVCPYCNRNFINNALDSKSRLRRSSQVDHFFSSSSYPFLAMSFYNLIPSCSSCNLFKGTKSIDYSPYDDNNTSSELFLFNLSVKSFVDSHDLSQIDILIDIKDNIVKSNIDVFLLEHQYKTHNDHAQDLLIKNQMYTPLKLDELRRDFSSLNITEHDFKRIIYGNYLEKNDFYKRPLSKLTSDIVQMLIK